MLEARQSQVSGQVDQVLTVATSVRNRLENIEMELAELKLFRSHIAPLELTQPMDRDDLVYNEMSESDFVRQIRRSGGCLNEVEIWEYFYDTIQVYTMLWKYELYESHDGESSPSLLHSANGSNFKDEAVDRW
jgi:hypothetical protein